MLPNDDELYRYAEKSLSVLHEIEVIVVAISLLKRYVYN